VRDEASGRAHLLDLAGRPELDHGGPSVGAPGVPACGSCGTSLRPAPVRRSRRCARPTGGFTPLGASRWLKRFRNANTCGVGLHWTVNHGCVEEGQPGSLPGRTRTSEGHGAHEAVEEQEMTIRMASRRRAAAVAATGASLALILTACADTDDGGGDGGGGGEA